MGDIMKREFEKICKLTQNELIRYNLLNLIQSGYKEVFQENGFVYAKGDIPVLLVAHMDTVHKLCPTIIEYRENGNILSSPQGIGGDDRCGVYMIHEVIKELKCSVLFTEDEEIGCVGAKKFADSPYINDLNVNYMIEFDRKGSTDAVFYECNNEEFSSFIVNNSNFIPTHGSFTDICKLMPAAKTAGVNISCGYYNAHAKDEYVNLQEMKKNIERVKQVIKTPAKHFEYIEALPCYDYLGDYLGFGSSLYYECQFDKTYERLYCIEYTPKKKNKFYLGGKFAEVCARTEEEAVGTFLINNPTLSYSCITSIYEL